MIASRTSIDRADDELDQALLDPEGLLTQSLQAQDTDRRRRLIGVAAIALSGFCGLVVVSLLSNTASARDQTSRKTEEATRLWMDRKLEDAELAFLDTIRLNEDDSTAWNGLGWVRNNQGKHDKALEAFQKCLAINPRHGAAVNGMGQCLTAKKDYEQARKWLLKGSEEYFERVPADRISPQSLPAAAFGLVRVSLLTERYDDAEKWAKKLLEHKPDDKQIQGYLLAAKSKSNREIKEEFDLIEQRRKTADLWKQPRGSAKAVEGFRALLKKDENDTIALNGLGFMLLNSGKHKEAMPLFEKCIKLKPKHYGARNGLARCYSDSGQTDKAIEIWEEICDNVPMVNAATMGLAHAYLKQKDYKKALPFLRQITDSEATTNAHYEEMLEKAKAGVTEE